MRVLEDVRQEKMTVGHALTEYAVVVDPARLQLDPEATAARCAEMRRRK